MHVLSIDSVHCHDARLVGAKAAHLARARALGFPVPDAVVVPCSQSDAVLAAAAAQIATGGVHAGQLAVMAADPGQFAGLFGRVRPLGEPLAIRSSAPIEADPLLAGSFTSFFGITHHDLATAILGVWSSALRHPHARDNRASHGSEAMSWPLEDEVSMGVIIQRELDPAFAGSAHVTPTGDVRIVGTAGSAAALMAGWQSGVAATVGDSGSIVGESAVSLLGTQVLTEVAALARDIQSALGDTLVEWAYADGEVWLLQSRPAANDISTPPRRESSPLTLSTVLARRVANTIRTPGELAEHLLMPWSIAHGVAVELGEVTSQLLDDPLAAWHDLQRVSQEVTDITWRASPGGHVDLVKHLALTIEDGGAGIIDDLKRLEPPDVRLVDEFTTHARQMAAHLTALGLVRNAVEFWALPVNLEDVMAQSQPRSVVIGRAHRAALRWEPLLYTAIVAAGEARGGEAVARGIASGPAVVVDVAGFEAAVELAGLPPRSVLVAARPLPRYAPLLMAASGLVTSGGSEAAHLIEVARALGIPAVVGCDLSSVRNIATSVIAVDGYSGDVHVLNLDR